MPCNSALMSGELINYLFLSKYIFILFNIKNFNFLIYYYQRKYNFIFILLFFIFLFLFLFF